MVLTSLVQVQQSVPAQWHGHLEDGRALFIRARNGFLQAWAAQDIDAALDWGVREIDAIIEFTGMGIDVNPDEEARIIDEMIDLARQDIVGGETLFEGGVCHPDHDLTTTEMLDILKGEGLSVNLT
jgi:hypothetical protein